MSLLLVALAGLMGLAPEPPGADTGRVPEVLREVVLGASKQPRSERWLGGERFGALERGGAPFLLWPLESPLTEVGPGRDPEQARAWLARRGEELAHAGFEPVLDHRSLWRAGPEPRTLDVLEFRLEREGLALLDARVRLYFDGERFVGLLNDFPAPLGARVPLPAAVEGVERVWLAIDRGSEPIHDLFVARVERERVGETVRTRYRVQGRPLPPVTIVSSAVQVQVASFEHFSEYAVPLGNFPDQVDADSSGAVWFSQPNQDLLTRFDPGAVSFTSFALASGSTPDGLCIDAQDRIWTGLYDAGELGTRGTSGAFSAYPLPYPSARPAIPLATSSGRVWITDHLRNRVSEFDPAGPSWAQSLVVPTPSAWVVAGVEHLSTGTVYFTEYLANRLAVVDPGQPGITELANIGGGPAFATIAGDKLYWTQWNRDRLGEYDLATGLSVEYQYPIVGEFGGPIAARKDGRVVVGTRNVGYVMVFDPLASEFDAYMIPTGVPGLKDGLAVDGDGAIWFAESGANKLARLALGPSVK